MLSWLEKAVLDSDFQPKPKLPAPLQRSDASQCAHDRIHYSPPSHHMARSSGELIMSSRLDVAIPAGRGKNCEINSATSPDPFSS